MLMKIIIYSTSACAPCHSLTDWLDKLALSYDKRLIDNNPNLMLEFMAINDGMIAVPLTIVENSNGQITKISGFDQRKLKQALNIL